MITRAEIIEVFENKVRVRIPIFDNIPKARQFVPDDELSLASILVVPGVEVQYKPGDIVVVGFENNVIGQPIVLGYLKSALDTSAERNVRLVATELKVTEKLDAPVGTVIGSIDYSTLKSTVDNNEEVTDERSSIS